MNIHTYVCIFVSIYVYVCSRYGGACISRVYHKYPIINNPLEKKEKEKEEKKEKKRKKKKKKTQNSNSFPAVATDYRQSDIIITL